LLFDRHIIHFARDCQRKQIVPSKLTWFGWSWFVFIVILQSPLVHAQPEPAGKRLSLTQVARLAALPLMLGHRTQIGRGNSIFAGSRA